jgi:Uma2 family endonuclease
MSLVTPPMPASPKGAPVLLRNASWALYEMMLREANGQNLKLTYDRGRLSIVSPLPIHERWKRIIGRLIEDALRLENSYLTAEDAEGRRGSLRKFCQVCSMQAAAKSVIVVTLRYQNSAFLGVLCGE